MATAFIIYVKAVIIYAVLTLPALVLFPPLYLFSLYYVFFYGWFAWALFTIIFLLTRRTPLGGIGKTGLLLLGVPVCVGLAFYMIGVLDKMMGDLAWEWTPALLFPLAAVIAGWVSVLLTYKNILSGKEQTCVTVEDILT